MRRIMLIGCGGSGKSTLAARLGEELSLPVYHLDRMFWQPGWQELPKNEWHALQTRTCAEPEWIMDGNYGGSMELRFAAADTIIFLDLPTLTCICGVFQRFLRFRGRPRPDMSEGCPERLTWEFLQWVWTYRRTRRPKILARLRELEETKHVVVLHSRRAVRQYLQSMAERRSGS